MELLLEQEREIEQLRSENSTLKEQVDIQRVKLEQVGSIAEAAMQLSGIFEAPQKVADLYIQSVQPIQRVKRKLEMYPMQERPTISGIEKELFRLKSNRGRRNNIAYVIVVSLIASALIIIATNLCFSVLRVVGSSMQNTLQAGDVMVCCNIYKDIACGEIIAFYNNGRILLE